MSFEFWDNPNVPTIVRVLFKIIIGWIIAFYRLILGLLRGLASFLTRNARHKWSVRCRTFPSDLWLRPDVYIYSQKWLLAHGIAVTWDNPDIQLYRKQDGQLVNSYQLQPDTEYDIIARIHNRSINGPAFGVKVDFSLRHWGINGLEIQPIGQTKVDVSVLGGSINPADAKITWKTPSAPGHYCIVASLNPPDDLDVGDNEGQENTQVVDVTPGDPEFIIPVFNLDKKRHRYKIIGDSYKLPKKPIPYITTTPDTPKEQTVSRQARQRKVVLGFVNPENTRIINEQKRKEAQLARVIDANRIGKFPIPTTWRPKFSATEITIPPGERGDISFSFHVPDEALDGQIQEFNLSALDEIGKAVGGVTIQARVKKGS